MRTGIYGATRGAATGAGRPRPPNDWVSFFGGPAWTWEPRRDQFYLHTFLPEQPDLNWRQPAVRAAMLDVVRFWLARGVDGFRLDVFNVFFKHPDLPDNPRARVSRWRRAGWRAWDRQEHIYDKDQPEMADLLAEFRAIARRRTGADERRRAVHRRPGMGGLVRRAAPPHLRLRAAAAALGGRPAGPTPSTTPRLPSGPTAGQPSCSATTTSRARPRGSRVAGRA